MCPDCREFGSIYTRHVEVANHSPATEVKHCETDDSRTLVSLRRVGAVPTTQEKRLVTKHMNVNWDRASHVVYSPVPIIRTDTRGVSLTAAAMFRCIYAPANAKL